MRPRLRALGFVPATAARFSQMAGIGIRKLRRVLECGGLPPLSLANVRLAALSLCLLAACSVSEPKAGLVVINGPDPQTLDPALATSLEDMRVVNGIFEGLTRYDPVTARPIPGLAEKWEISPDGRVYLFHLRDQLFWSAGQPITADDVLYSWRRVLDPQTAAEYAGQLYYVKNAEAYNNGSLKDPNQVGVHALDSRTLRVELNNPTAFFLDLCAFQTLSVVPRQFIAKFGGQWMRAANFPTSGPYLLEAWRLNYKVRLRKNPFYWDAVHTRTEVIDFLCSSAPNATLNLYQTGQADVIWDLTSIPNELVDELKKRPDYHSFPYLGTYFFRFNTTKKPFDDPRVRRALALAIDKPRLVAKFLHAGETVADHLVPDGTANYQPVAGLGYDPALARRLLAEAGFPDGRGFPRFHYLFDASAGGGGIHEQLAVELQHAWQELLGIHADLAQMEKKSIATPKPAWISIWPAPVGSAITTIPTPSSICSAATTATMKPAGKTPATTPSCARPISRPTLPRAPLYSSRPKPSSSATSCPSSPFSSTPASPITTPPASRASTPI